MCKLPELLAADCHFSSLTARSLTRKYVHTVFLKSCLLATTASHRHFSDQVQEHYCHVGTCQSRDECSCNRFTSSPTKESTSLSKATMNQYWNQISPSKCCYESIYRCYIKKEGFLDGLWMDLSYQAAPLY